MPSLVSLIASSKPAIQALLLACAALSIAFSGFAAAVFMSDFGSAVTQARPWMNPVITKEEVRAMSWIRENSMERDVFVTDIFGGEYLMGSTLREGTEGGDWAIVPNVVTRMGDINEFYQSATAQKAHELAVKYSAKYAIIPNRQVFAGFNWFRPETKRFESAPTLFEPLYEDNGFQIYRVL